MWEERSRHDWGIASTMLCQQYNANRGKNDRARRPADFDPWTRIDQERQANRDDSDGIDRLTRDWVGAAEDGTLYDQE